MPRHKPVDISITVDPPQYRHAEMHSKQQKLQVTSPMASPISAKSAMMKSPTTPTGYFPQQQQQQSVTKLLPSRRSSNQNVTHLCDDAVRHIMTFSDWKTSLSLREVNAASQAVVTTFDFYWHYESDRVRKIEEIPRTVSSFQEFVHVCKVIKHKHHWDKLKIAKFRKYEPLYRAVRLIYGGLSPFLLTIGLLLVTLFIPLLVDGTISEKLTSVYALVPIFICIILPSVVLAIGLTLDALIIQPICVSRLADVSSKVRNHLKFFEVETAEDTLARHASVMVVWQLMSIPINLIALYVKYTLFRKDQWTPFAATQYIFTALYTFVPLIQYALARKSMVYENKKAKKRVYTTMFIVHAHGVVLNLLASLQIAVVCARVDELISGPWYLLLIPVYALTAFEAVVLLGFALVYFCSSKMRTSVNSVLLLTSATFTGVSISFTISMVLTSLALEHIITISYFIASIPMLFAAIALVPVVLLTGMLCTYNSIKKKKITI